MSFAALHRGDLPLVLPNAWDVASALLLQQAGFAAIGTTSLGVNAVAGVPDAAGAGRDLAVALARALAPRLRVPLSVDLEGGYSDDPGEVAELARQLADCGVAGINLEDGRADGTLRPLEQHAAVVAAVRAAAPDLFVNARTDVHWLRIGAAASRSPEAARRLRAYREAGASGAFVPGLTDLAETADLAAAVDLPLNVLWTAGSDLHALAAAGVARVSTGSALYRHAMAAALDAATAARTGSLPTTTPVTYDEVQGWLA
jgi:2-methylisocitrate lyase-like PEP mutase family enzyme